MHSILQQYADQKKSTTPQGVANASANGTPGVWESSLWGDTLWSNRSESGGRKSDPTQSVTWEQLGAPAVGLAGKDGDWIAPP